jgi:hypothetical protein
MQTVRSFAFASLTPVLVGCAIHPLPEDVTRKTTYDIVEQARCEAKHAVMDYARGIKNAAIAYEFTFHITEMNNAAGDVTWTYPFLTGGSFSLMAGAGALRTRDAMRNFRIVDTFDDLRKADCSQEAIEKNWVYPMAGDIGVYEVVATFVRIQKDAKLQAKASEVYTFADTLIFTTTLNAGVNPSLTLSPVTERFLVTGAHANLDVHRTDTHQVVLGLSTGTQTTANGTIVHNMLSRSGGLGAAIATPLASGSSVLTTTLIQDGSSARDRALIELDRQRILALQARTPNLLVGP